MIITFEVNPILHCNRALLSKYTMYRIGLISEVIVISIINQSLFCNPISSHFFPKRFLHFLYYYQQSAHDMTKFFGVPSTHILLSVPYACITAVSICL